MVETDSKFKSRDLQVPGLTRHFLPNDTFFLPSNREFIIEWDSFTLAVKKTLSKALF